MTCGIEYSYVHIRFGSETFLSTACSHRCPVNPAKHLVDGQKGKQIKSTDCMSGATQRHPVYSLKPWHDPAYNPTATQQRRYYYQWTFLYQEGDNVFFEPSHYID